MSPESIARLLNMADHEAGLDITLAQLSREVSVACDEFFRRRNIKTPAELYRENQEARINRLRAEAAMQAETAQG